MQVESLQEQVCDLHKKVDDQRELSSKRAMQQQETLSRLHQTLEEKVNEGKEAEAQLEHCNTVLTKLLHGIEDIFHLVRCDSAPILALLGK